ncbi:MAG TPA: hypothetical protein VIU34_13540 [Steroidobacter sp.]
MALGTDHGQAGQHAGRAIERAQADIRHVMRDDEFLVMRIALVVVGADEVVLGEHVEHGRSHAGSYSWIDPRIAAAHGHERVVKGGVDVGQDVDGNGCIVTDADELTVPRACCFRKVLERWIPARAADSRGLELVG